MPIPYLGCSCLRMMTASQGAGLGLAWAWEGGGSGPSKEGRKRPRALRDRHGHTPPVCPPAAQWLTAQAAIRCWGRGNPGREQTKKGS